jgi:putative ABC transport system permease protein
MPTRTILQTALLALGRNRLRTTLTVLSLVIGVAAVITIVSLGAGAQAALEEHILSAGSNLIVVRAGNRSAGGVRLGMGSSSRLTAEDADALRRDVHGIRFVSASIRTRQQLINGARNWAATIEGVDASLPQIRNWPVAAGAFFSPADVARAAKVCVIGTTVRDLLFGPSEVAVGSSIRVGAHIFRVAGVLTSKGQSAGGEDQDDTVFVPYTTAQKKLMGVTYLRNILVSAADTDNVPHVVEEIRRLLRFRHEIAPGEPEDFRIRSLQEIVAIRTRATRTMATLLSGVAAVSLLVGGIGVMNIMLVSVTERTREIGIRLAIGARGRDVRRQFLAEAILLSTAGGVAGVGVGIAASGALTGLLHWPTLVHPFAAAGALAFTALVGVFFGWYPARRAAAVDPIDALRYE